MTSNNPSSQGSDLAVLIGTVLAGRYRLTRDLGSGATTAIFDATDEETGQEVTFKLIRPRLAAVPEFRDRFDDVMRGAADLRHPNIAIVYDYGYTPVATTESAFVVTERLTGGSLRDLFDRGRRLSPSQALVVGLDACRALDVAHRRQQVHGELVPSKIVFGDDRRLRIVDFGLSRLIGRLMWADPSNVPNHVAAYASPEQAKGERLGGKSDVYSLALTLTEAITGSLPFKAESTTPTLAARIGRLLPVTADMGPLASVLEHAARPDVEDRSTAAEFGKDLVQIATRLPRPEPLPLLSVAPPSDRPSAGDRPSGGAAAVVATVDARSIERPVVQPAVDSDVDELIEVDIELDEIGDDVDDLPTGESIDELLRDDSTDDETLDDEFDASTDDDNDADDDGDDDDVDDADDVDADDADDADEVVDVDDVDDDDDDDLDGGFALLIDDESDDADDESDDADDADDDDDEVVGDDDDDDEVDDDHDEAGAGAEDDQARDPGSGPDDDDTAATDSDPSGDYEPVDLTGIDMGLDAASSDGIDGGVTGVIPVVGSVDDGATGVIAAIGESKPVSGADDGETGVIAAVTGPTSGGPVDVVAAGIDDGETGIIPAIGSNDRVDIDADDAFATALVSMDDGDLDVGYDDLDAFDIDADEASDDRSDEFDDGSSDDSGEFEIFELIEQDDSSATGIIAVTQGMQSDLAGDETGVVPVVEMDYGNHETGVVPVTAGAAAAGAAAQPPATADDMGRDDDSDGERRRSIPWKTISGAVVVLGLVVLGLVAYRLLATPKYEVPELAGLSLTEAETRIASYKWDVRVSGERSDQYPNPDDVIRTNPAAGAELAEGEPFEIVASEGPVQRELPDLTGADAQEAQAQLQALGMVVTVERANDDAIEAGKVIRWYVPGDESIGIGSFVDPKTEIILVVSDGPAKRPVPDVVGKPLPEATAAIEQAGLVLAIESRVGNAALPVDTVVSQAVAAGTEVDYGSEIGVVLSELPTEAVFPDVTGITVYEEMKTLVEAAGFTTLLQLGDGTGPVSKYTIDGAVPETGQVFPLGTEVRIETG